MTIHSCRDLFLGSGSVGLTTGAIHSMHAMSDFMQGVLGYTFHSRRGSFVPPTGSSVSFNYTSYNGSTFDFLSQSTWPYRSASIHINLGAGKENYVQLPLDVVNLMSAAYPVNWPTSSAPWPAGGDPLTFRFLAIKSDDFPLANSGLFLITSVSLPDNALIIDYRSTSFPFVQTSSYVTASLWPFMPTGGDAGITALTTNGSSSGYQTSGVATYPRMILDSPSPNGWQVRLCVEGPNDRSDGGNAAALTAMPGYSGSNGDFPTGSFLTESQHLHFGQWRNLQVAVATIAGSTVYQGLAPGLDMLRVGGSRRQRMFMWGDDQTGTMYTAIRNNTSMNDAFVVFGEPEDPEPVPHPVNRLFVVGCCNIAAGIDWRGGNFSADLITGLSYSLNPRMGPISTAVCPWVYITQSSVSGGIQHDTAAGDSPFLSGSELVSVELMAGTWPGVWRTQPGSDAHIMNIEPRRLGRFPFARMGRCRGTNATGSWYATTPNLDWFHIECGVYLPWGGIGSLP